MGSGSCGVLCKGRPVMRDLEAYKQPPRGCAVTETSTKRTATEARRGCLRLAMTMCARRRGEA